MAAGFFRSVGRGRTLRLRARIVALFTLGGAGLSLLLAATSYSLARANLLETRESNAVESAQVNAVQVQGNLGSGADNDLLEEVIAALSTQAGAVPLINVGTGPDDWRGTAALGPQDLPEELRTLVIDDRVAARMRFQSSGDTLLAVGIPLPRADASYFELSTLTELEENLRNLGIVLIIGGAVATVGGAAFGFWAASRVLQPIEEISAAAGAIAGGRLDTRLTEVDDPDLATLVRSFNDMAGGLQDRIARDARFASDVSHELRSPLTTIRASIDVLNGRRDEMSDRSVTALDLLSDDVDRFERLIGDLLEISRLDSGSVPGARDLVDLGDVVHAALAVRHDDVPVVVDPDAAGVRVIVDKRRVAQMVTNLVENANRYAGGVELVRLERHEAEIHMAVQDTGPGVAPDERDRIFERFSRGSAAGQRGSGGGTGLGLALVREHARLHGGRVWVEDRPDGEQGARFVVALPVNS